MKKKGFTLIELLSVIVILAIIILIATPLVLNIVETVKKSSFEASVRGVISAVENTCVMQKLNNETLTTEYILNDGLSSPSLNVKGNLPKTGTILVNDECNVNINVSNGKYVINKEFEDTEIVFVDTEMMHDLVNTGFYKVSGTSIVDSNNQPYIMKGMGFGNNVWIDSSTPLTNYNDEENYKELADLGFNSVRYYLNTNLLVNKNNTEEWNEAGFNWLNQNIEWAKKYGIVLELNLHVPPGGFMSSTNANFWKDEANITLFKKIWQEIATRYKEETTIIGYGLMNEPFLPEMSDANEVLDTYYGLINETISLIRQIDKNHIFFIESPYGYIGSKTTYYGYTDSFRLVNDSNVVYEYHFYYSNNYSNQGLSYTNNDSKIYYNDNYDLQINGGYKLISISKELSTSSYDYLSDGWQYIESPLTKLNNGTNDVNSAYWLMYLDNVGAEGTVYFDDLIIKEYDENKKFIRNIRIEDFNSTTTTLGWDLQTGGGGKTAYQSEIGNNGLGSVSVTGASSSYRFYTSNLKLFLVNENHYYTIGVYVKFSNCNSDITITPAFQLTTANTPHILNEDYLDFMLQKYVNIGIENNVPMYIGEFGLPVALFGNEYNGEEWVSDMFDLFEKYKLNYAYHDFHNTNWGYYSNDMNKPCANRNEILKNVFIEKLK